MQKQKISENQELYGEYGKVFNFTQGDLEANRAGFVTYRQRSLYRRFTFQAIGFLFLIILILFALIYAFNMAYTGIHDRTLFGIVAVVAGFPSLFFVVKLAQFLFDYARDLSQRRVSRYQGRVTLSSRFYRGQSLFYASFADSYLKLSATEYYALSKNLEYKIYQMPHGKIILSVEEALPEQD